MGVKGPDQTGLVNARVTVRVTGHRDQHEALTDARGIATFEKVGGQVSISISHAIGNAHRNAVAVPVDGQRTELVTLEPGGIAVGLLPPRILDADLNPDRSELVLHTEIIAARPPGFILDMLSYPHVRLNDCWVRFPAGASTPTCQYSDGTSIAVTAYSHDADGPAVSGMGGATMVLIDQSLGTSRYDPHDIRWMATRRFLDVVHEAPAGSSRPVAVAGFNDAGSNDSWSPLLLPGPAWDAADPASAFHVSAPVRDATLEGLQFLGGGGAATLAAFTEAFELMQQHAPPGERVLVALIGPPDEQQAAEVVDAAQLAALAQSQADAGVRSIIITARLAEKSPARARLADLSAALGAPLIVAGYPAEWNQEYYNKDGLYEALQFAGQIVSGASLSVLKASFRIRAPPGTRFEAGTMLRGSLHVWSDVCPMGCGELPLEFSARIP